MKDLNRNKIVGFFKDKLLAIIVILLNTFLVFLFFYSTIEAKVELLYPTIISSFLVIIYIIIEWFRFYNFSFNMEKSIDDPYYNLTTSTFEQSEVNEVMKRIHNNYLKKLNDLSAENNMKNKFFAQWIHNLKTPVTVMDLILQREEEGKFNKEDIDSLRMETRIMNDSLQSVLNFIRLEEFSKDYIPSSVDILQSINKVIKRNKSLFIYNNVFPKIDIENKKFYVLSDEKWNEFIIEQIISNGIKYSTSLEISKYITFKINIENEQYLTLKIIDEGIGIPCYDLHRVFEPFFTGENGRKNKGSTGIGLYMCSLIAKKLNHKLEIHSEVGIGTEVSIRYILKK